ncbi:MAG TPA: hypothetical protein VF884_02235 [Nitrososphaeraceae archaeon]
MLVYLKGYDMLDRVGPFSLKDARTLSTLTHMTTADIPTKSITAIVTTTMHPKFK